MTRLSEGFEGGSDGAGVTTSNTIFTNTGGTAAKTFDAAGKLLGSLAMKIVNAATFGYMQYLWGSSQTNQYVRFYYNAASRPSAGQNIICQIQNGGTNRAQLTLTSAGKFNIRSPATLKASGANIYPGWVRLEWDLVGTVQTLRIFSGANLYGTTPDEVLSPGAGSITVSGFDRINFGNSAAETFTQYFDGIEIDSAATPGPATDPTPPATQPTLVWDGSSMVDADPKWWNGTTLEDLDAYWWDGSTLA
jgi:hypothetical protein